MLMMMKKNENENTMVKMIERLQLEDDGDSRDLFNCVPMNWRSNTLNWDPIIGDREKEERAQDDDDGAEWQWKHDG